MSVFGNAKKVGIKKEALDTKKWISDEELYSLFFEETRDDDIVKDINELIAAPAPEKHTISVKTNANFNEANYAVKVA
ncbi:hypothetical protein [Limosilactobacillus sp.]|uniref:hypothetical protein n=1 Tax=Limosilactobacillus sp. TaxID=2773925 RepID=UPI003EFEC70F